MSRYKYLLWDLDGTLLDFAAAEKTAIKTLFKKYEFGDCSDEMIAGYSKINRKYWEALERNEIEKPRVLVGRFEDFFAQEGLDPLKAHAFNSDYQLALGDTIVFCDDSFEIVSELKGKYIQCGITNGTKIAQDKKLSASGFDKLLDYIFISEELGYEKPNKGFFDAVIKETGITDLSEALVIGDSLTSDIKGGNDYGIDTCWYNPTGKAKKIPEHTTYEIRDLHEIYELI